MHYVARVINAGGLFSWKLFLDRYARLQRRQGVHPVALLRRVILIRSGLHLVGVVARGGCFIGPQQNSPHHANLALKSRLVDRP